MGVVMKVSKFLKLHGMLVLNMHPDFTLAEASRRFARPMGGRKFSVAVVTSGDEQLGGVISLGDIAHALGEHEDKAAGLLVREVMTTKVLTCTPDDNLEDVLKLMADNGIRHMPVVENGRLAGLVSRRDALEFLYQQASLDVAHLTDWLFRSDARY
jgi:CBS domain-containing protein